MQTTAWAVDETRSPAHPTAIAASATPDSSPTGAASTPPPPPSPVLGGLRQTNPFDANRQLWPDRTPVPPPPPPPLPPPIPAPITDDDLEIYGVVNAGGVQKALLKLGKRFANVPVGPTGLASVAVGMPIGEFVLAKVEPDQILLQAPGGQQWVRFSVKKERMGKDTRSGMPSHAGFAPQPSGANAAPMVNPFNPGSGSPSAMGGMSNEIAPLPTAATAPPSLPSSAPSAPGSLAAAIAAAQAAQTASGGGAVAPAPAIPPGMNPFEALLKQQQGR